MIRVLLAVLALLVAAPADAQQQYDPNGRARVSLYGTNTLPGDTTLSVDGSGDLKVTCISGCAGASLPTVSGIGTSLAVSNATSRVAFGDNTATFPAALLTNDGATEVFYALGNGAVNATTANPALPAGYQVCVAIGANVDIAAITASSTSTLRVTQVSACPVISGGGSSGGAPVTSVSATLRDSAGIELGTRLPGAQNKPLTTGPAPVLGLPDSHVAAVMGAPTDAYGNVRVAAWLYDGKDYAGIAKAFTAPDSSIPALVVGLSPNAPLPAGANIVGAVTQSGGPWTVNCTIGCSGGTFNNNADAVATSATNGQSAAWLYAFNGTTWDRLRVDGSKNLNVNIAANSFGTLTVSGTITANQGTSPWVENVSQFGGSNVATGTGASGVGIPRVTVANDSNILATQSGTWTVQQGTPPWSVSQSGNWTARIVGNAGGILDAAGQNAASPANEVLTACQFNTSPTTISSGNVSPVQCDNGGKVLVNTGTVTVTGTVSATQGTSPWVSNVTQFGSNNVATGTGASGVGIPRVTVANDSNILTTQSGTWTVQPGNTANTTPWLTTARIVGNTGAILDAAGQNAASPANELLIAGQFNTAPTTITNGNISPLQLDSSGNLKVNVAVGAATGATDEAAFTAGVTTFTASGGVFNDSVASLASGQQGAFRATSNRALHHNLRDSAGGEVGSILPGANNKPVQTAAAPLLGYPDNRRATVVGAANDTYGNLRVASWITDGVHYAGVAAAGKAADPSIPALVVQLSPNQPNTTTALNVNCTVGCSGGSFNNNSDAVATSATNGQAAAWLYGFNGATWDRLRVDGSKNLDVNCVVGCAGGTFNNNVDAVATSATNGQSAAWLYAFNGTTFDRLRDDGSFNLMVNCAVGCAGGTFNNNADAVATSATNGQVAGWLYGFNGTTWDRLRVDGSKNLNVNIAANSFGTVTVSGTVTANQGGAPWSQNVTQFGGVNISTGTGASGTGIPRVTVANDSNILATQSGTWTVQQGTPPWSVAGNIASGVADSGNPVKVGGVFNTTQPTVTNTQRVDAQATARGALIVATGVDAFAVNATLSAETTKVIGTVNQGTSPWVANITQFGSVNISTGTGASGTGIPRVTVANDSNILATQSGTWTVQPGNTANTTPWLTTISQGGNAATVNASGQLNVNVASSAADNSTFTAGTTPFEGVGGVFNDGVTSLTSGNEGEVRLTGNRAMHENLRDSSGREIGAGFNIPGAARTPIVVQQALNMFQQPNFNIKGSTVNLVPPTIFQGGLNDQYGNARVASMLTDGIHYAGVTTPYTPPDASKSALVVAMSPIQNDPCSGSAKTNAPIGTAGATNVQVIPPAAGKKVYICSITIVIGASTAVSIIEGTGAACTTANEFAIYGSTTAASGMPLPANGGFTQGNGGNTVGVTSTPGNGICVLTNASVAFGGTMTYVQQ